MEKDELLRKWLSGKLTKAEQEAFEKLDEYQLNRDILEGAMRFKASHFSKPRSFDAFKEAIHENKSVKVKQLIPYKKLARIAAVMVISLGLYFIIFSNAETTIHTMASQKTVFELPDASIVSLNSQSSVSYNKKKWSKHRSLSLEGEAFFEVAKGSKFDVETSAGVVSVLGTKFTVKQRKEYFEVQCFEGIVGVAINDTNYKLTKGKIFRILQNKTVLDSIHQIRPDWIQNRSTFKSIPLYLVIAELERQFAIQVEVENVDSNRLFTGGFDHTNVDSALESITSPFNLTYNKEGETKYRIQ